MPRRGGHTDWAVPRWGRCGYTDWAVPRWGRSRLTGGALCCCAGAGGVVRHQGAGLQDVGWNIPPGPGSSPQTPHKARHAGPGRDSGSAALVRTPAVSRIPTEDKREQNCPKFVQKYTGYNTFLAPIARIPSCHRLLWNDEGKLALLRAGAAGVAPAGTREPSATGPCSDTRARWSKHKATKVCVAFPCYAAHLHGVISSPSVSHQKRKRNHKN